MKLKMIFKREIKCEFDYWFFNDFCECNYLDYKETDLLNDTLIKKYFEDYCGNSGWCDDYEGLTFMENKEKIIPKIQSIVRKKYQIK